MKRSIALAVVGVLPILGFCASASAVLRTWTGATGTPLWSQAGNWSPVGVPTGADDAQILVSSSTEIHFPGGASTVASLLCTGTLVIDGGTFTVTGTATVPGHLRLAGGTIAGGSWELSNPATINSNPNNRISGVTIDGDIKLDVPGSQLRVADGMEILGQVRLEAANTRLLYENTQTWAGATVVALPAANATITPAAAGLTLTLGSGFALEGGNWTITGGPLAPTVMNEGLLRATSGTLSQIRANTFSNMGSVRSLAGTLSIDSDHWTNPGGSLLALGGVMRFGGGMLDNTGWTLSLNPNFGTFLLDGATIKGGMMDITPPGALTVSNNAANRLDGVMVSGHLSLMSPGSQLRILHGLDVKGDVLVGPGAELGFEGTQTWGPAHVMAFGTEMAPARIGIAHLPGTDLTLAPTFVLDGSWWRFNAGTGFDSWIESHGLLQSSDGESEIGGSPFRNEGEVRAEFGLLRLPTNLWNLDCETLEHGTWAAGVGGTMIWPIEWPSIHKLRCATVLQAGRMLCLPDGKGSLDAFRSLRKINSESLFRLDGGQEFLFEPCEGSLSIFGRLEIIRENLLGVEGNLWNDGVVTIGPYAEFGIDGSYWQAGCGRLDVAFESAAEWPPLFAFDDVELDGTLAVEFEDGFMPAPCEPIIVAASFDGAVTGTFWNIIPPCGGLCPVAPYYGPSFMAIYTEGGTPTAECQELTVQLDPSGHAVVTGDQLVQQPKGGCPIESIEPSSVPLSCADVGTVKVPVTVTFITGVTSECVATIHVLATPRFTGGSGNWSAPENWCTGLPTDMSEVTIHSFVDVTTDDAVAHSVLIEQGGKLRVGIEDMAGESGGAVLTVVDSIIIESGGTLEIRQQGTVHAGSITVGPGGVLMLDDPTALLTVAGLTIQPGAKLIWNTGTIELSGVMQVPDGLFIGCSAPGDFAASSLLRLMGGTVVAPSIEICGQGALVGSGTVISAIVVNAGLLSPGERPAWLNIAGDLVVTDAGTVRIDLAGTDPVDGFALLTVTGAASIAGTVEVVLDGVFQPQLGDLFAVISVGGSVDAPNPPLLPALEPGLAWSWAWKVVGTTTTLELEVQESTLQCQDATLQLGPDGTAILTPEMVLASTGSCEVDTVELSQSFFDCSDVGVVKVEVAVFCTSGRKEICDAEVTVVATPRYLGPPFGLWFDPTNWCSGIPTSATDVTVYNFVTVTGNDAVAQSVTIEPGGWVLVAGLDEPALAGDPVSFGTLAVTDTITIQDQGGMTVGFHGLVSANAIVVQSGGVLRIDSPSALLLVHDLTIEPGGVLELVSGTLKVSGTMTSASTIVVGDCDQPADGPLPEAHLVLDGGVVEGPELRICNQGRLSGDGSVECELTTIEGEISPGTSPGTIAFGQTVGAEFGSLMFLELAGTEPGTGYDQLIVLGDLTSEAEILVVLDPEFDPSCGDLFDVVRVAGSVDDLGSISAPEAPPGFYWEWGWIEVGDETVLRFAYRRIADFNDDCIVNGDDLGTLLGAWGPCDGCEEDLNHDGIVNGDDLGTLLGLWG